MVQEGKLEVTVGKRTFMLQAGDAAQFAADSEHSVRNAGTKKAEWLLVIHSLPRVMKR